MERKEINLFLQERVSDLLGKDWTSESIKIQCRHDVSLVELKDRNHRFVIKDISRNAFQKTPDNLDQILKKILFANPSIDRFVPKILGMDPARGWIIMEYIPGPTLEALLQPKLWRHANQNDEIEYLLRDVADFLKKINQINDVDLGWECSWWSNRNVEAEFEAIFTDPSLRRFLPEIESVYNRFQKDIFDRKYQNISLVDCQPKNILIPGPRSLRFIDLEFSVTNPWLGIAHFLVSLDRLGLKYPTPSFLAGIASWKKTFLSAYMEGLDSSVVNDLVFLYPATLARVYRWHYRQRRWFKPYLTWYYGNRLKQYFSRLIDLSPDRLRDDLGKVF